MAPQPGWIPPRPLLVSGSAGTRVPDQDMRALVAATDLVERGMHEHQVVPYGDVLAVEVTVRYSAKARAARVRRDPGSPMLACFVVDEPIDEMMSEDLESLTHRFARALLDCLDAGREAGLLDRTRVQAARDKIEQEFTKG